MKTNKLDNNSFVHNNFYPEYFIKFDSCKELLDKLEYNCKNNY